MNHPRKKCEACQEQKLKSKVFCDGETRTLLGWKPYYDEEGVYHSHNPNNAQECYKCSNGHMWVENVKIPCPVTYCDWNK